MLLSTLWPSSCGGTVPTVDGEVNIRPMITLSALLSPARRGSSPKVWAGCQRSGLLIILAGYMAASKSGRFRHGSAELCWGGRLKNPLKAGRNNAGSGPRSGFPQQRSGSTAARRLWKRGCPFPLICCNTILVTTQGWAGCRVSLFIRPGLLSMRWVDWLGSVTPGIRPGHRGRRLYFDLSRTGKSGHFRALIFHVLTEYRFSRPLNDSSEARELARPHYVIDRIFHDVSATLQIATPQSTSKQNVLLLPSLSLLFRHYFYLVNVFAFSITWNWKSEAGVMLFMDFESRRTDVYW